MAGSLICDGPLHWFMAFSSPDTAAFADDQLIAGLEVTLYNFRVGVVVETELDGDRCRFSVAQELRPATGGILGPPAPFGNAGF
jgi:hypothetical protein